MKRAALTTAALASLLVASGLSSAANLPGSFPGVTIDAKLIGGQEYEPLYARIPEWEKLTGAKVNILSKKNGFDIDKEFKADIAANTVNWCVGWNHTSFAPQYTSLYTDLSKLGSRGRARQIRSRNHQGVDRRRPALHAAARQIRRLRALLSQEQLHGRCEEEGVQGKIRLRPRPADHLAASQGPGDLPLQPAELLRHQFAGKEEAINGRFYEMLVAEGGEYLDSKGRPAFNSDAGVRALDWFVDLYKAKAVPPGTTNYLWDDLGNNFMSGTIAMDLDWPGYSTVFNDPKKSKVAGNVGIIVQPAGSSGKHTGWSGTHGLSVTQACKHKDAAASLIL